MGTGNGERENTQSHGGSSYLYKKRMGGNEGYSTGRRGFDGKYQEYKGRKFFKTKHGYWRSTDKPYVTMHRWVWQSEVGKIPQNHHVHHIDGNKDNNAIENLTVISPSEHAALHSRKYVEANKDKVKTHLDTIRTKSFEWHKSAEGRKRKREVLNAFYELAPKINKVCKYCGAGIIQKGSKEKVYCGPSCCASQRAGRVFKGKKHKKDEQ
jgi:hypothetical protein